jgi:hypothetical protein
MHDHVPAKRYLAGGKIRFEGGKMASRITALNHYRPMIEYRKTAGPHQVAEYIAMRTGLNRGEIIMVLAELHDAILFYNGQGQGVKLESLGTYLPNINYQGQFDVAYRMDSELKRALNAGDFSGSLRNKQSIGKSSDEIIALWNSEHPDDPVE